MLEFKKKKIVNILLLAEDFIVYADKYMEIMDAYYKNMDNQYKDEFAYNEYINFKEECKKGAKERGLI